MSAQPFTPAPDSRPGTAFAPMQLADIGEIASIEHAIYAAPWTEGNFIDSLNAGYCAWTLRTTGRQRTMTSGPVSSSIVGYFVLMAAVDEAHLLNVSIAAPWQAQGHGLFLLRKALALAIDYKASSLILEVRPSNRRAIEIYHRFGFREHGVRRRYYPASTADHQTREDAIVMRLKL